MYSTILFVGEAEREPLEQQREPVEEIPATPEAREVELRHEVVVVEDEARALALQRQRREQEQIRRIARVHDVEELLRCELAHEPSCSPEGRPVLAHVPAWASSGGGERIAVDLHTVLELEGVAVMLLPLRADDGYLEAGPPERNAFLPNTTVEWNRQVLHEEQRTTRRHLCTPRSPVARSHPAGAPGR